VRCCTNTETIEVPPEWAEVRWYDGNFPKIDLTDVSQEKTQLGDSRWRFGWDPVVFGTGGDGEEERSKEVD
jgi:hypothetical protein